MPNTSTATVAAPLTSRSGLSFELNRNGSIRRMQLHETTLNLFIGNELEGGPANLYLRQHGQPLEYIPLLGPRSPTRWNQDPSAGCTGHGSWRKLRYSIQLRLSDETPAWFWHVHVENTGSAAVELDLIYAQDVALAPYATVRMNEFYVSQYVDHTPLQHSTAGHVIASRQNLAASGRNPWCVIGSLRRGVSYATDAMQVHGLATRAGLAPTGLVTGLPQARLQHEHSMAAIQDEAVSLAAGATTTLGFFGLCVAHHAAATSDADLQYVDQALALAKARPGSEASIVETTENSRSLFSSAPMLAAFDLAADEVNTLFSSERRHEEFAEHGQLLAFFYAADRHVVLRAKELKVQRPHGHLLRTGRQLTPDETALTSTVWMNGVFNSMLTQGHVSINRFLSTTRSYLGLLRSQGQRVFVEIAGEWQLLDVPSAFEMTPDACRWIYRHTAGAIEVLSHAHSEPHRVTLELRVISGSPTRFLISHHIALNGDDGSTPGPVQWRREGDVIVITPAPGSELRARFPQGAFHIEPGVNTKLQHVGADEMLFADHCSRQQPFLCFVTAAAARVELSFTGQLVGDSNDIPREDCTLAQAAMSALHIEPPRASLQAQSLTRLEDIAPWYVHNALIHYLSPRGLEQYSGGGWGTRDVSQGPVELLLAFGQITAVRELLLRVMRAQQTDGDWPQWFMFFQREQHIRAPDSHGDIVFWPVLALAQYLIASGDEKLLQERVPFYGGARDGETTVWQHVERALALIEARVIQGTALAAYGHGDWNDALQPADPAMREHMCSAWTVTLHHQMLVTLARALRAIGREPQAVELEARAVAVQRDFQRLLVVDGVLTGYALFEPNGGVRYLLHPRDATSGVKYSALAMIHAVLEDMLTPTQAREHLQLIDTHLSGPDGVRLFDKPMPYHGGPQRFFQRAESATFFGREIGLMYMHAHLRYAQALAHVGDADRFFHALLQANPIGIRAVVPQATLRQANCYYSSSDAAFADRYQASEQYEGIVQGSVPLDGGWRVYSSGAGIAMSLIVRRFLGLSFEFDTLSLDPVIPVALDGMRVTCTLFGQPFEVRYAVRGRGCGVESVSLNDQALALAHADNPHRRGAARIEIAALRRLLNANGNVLSIALGVA
jgi:cellobiose phosphorylase